MATIKAHVFEIGQTYEISGPVAESMDNADGREFTVIDRNNRSVVIKNNSTNMKGYISMAMVFETDENSGEIVGHEILVLPQKIWGKDVKIKINADNQVERLPMKEKKPASKKSKTKTETVEIQEDESNEEPIDFDAVVEKAATEMLAATKVPKTKKAKARRK